MTRQSYDFGIADHGSVLILYPNTEAAKKHLEEKTEGGEAQWWGRGLVVEPRYWEAIHTDLVDHDFTVGPQW